MIDPKEVALRMGHPDLLEASSLDLDGMTVDFGIAGPESEFGNGFHAITQVGCDSHDPTAGTSAVESFATIEEAQAAIAEARAEFERSPTP